MSVRLWEIYVFRWAKARKRARERGTFFTESEAAPSLVHGVTLIMINSQLVKLQGLNCLDQTWIRLTVNNHIAFIHTRSISVYLREFE